MLTRTGDVVGTLAYMAPEQAEGRDAGAAADLYALALVLYEALAGVNPVRGRGAASTARRVGRAPARRSGACAATCRSTSAPRSTGAVLPRPEQRGTLADLRLALAARAPGRGGRGGDDRGQPARGRSPRPRCRALATPRPPRACSPRSPPARSRPPRSPGSAPRRRSRPRPPGPPPRRSSAVLPRVGWIALAAALATWLAAGQRPGTAVLVAAAAVPTAALLRRGGPLWSAPAIAPAARPRRPERRLARARRAGRPRRGTALALGALGAWWLVLAEAVADERLATGPPRDMGAWQRSTQHAWTDVLVPIVTNGALLVAALWALAALVLPYVVRGRVFALDLVGATIWAAALGSATQAVAPEMRGLVAGAVAAGGSPSPRARAAASRGEARSRSPS